MAVLFIIIYLSTYMFYTLIVNDEMPTSECKEEQIWLILVKIRQQIIKNC